MPASARPAPAPSRHRRCGAPPPDAGTWPPCRAVRAPVVAGQRESWVLSGSSSSGRRRRRRWAAAARRWQQSACKVHAPLPTRVTCMVAGACCLSVVASLSGPGQREPWAHFQRCYPGCRLVDCDPSWRGSTRGPKMAQGPCAQQRQRASPPPQICSRHRQAHSPRPWHPPARSLQQLSRPARLRQPRLSVCPPCKAFALPRPQPQCSRPRSGSRAAAPARWRPPARRVSALAPSARRQPRTAAASWALAAGCRPNCAADTIQFTVPVCSCAGGTGRQGARDRTHHAAARCGSGRRLRRDGGRRGAGGAV